MTNPLSREELIQIANRSVPEVWRTQLKKEVQPSQTLNLQIPSPRIVTVVWAGSSASGEMVLTIPSIGALLIAQALLGRSVDCVSKDTDLNDVVGELCNMIAGRVATELRHRGLTGSLHPPRVTHTSLSTIARPSMPMACLTQWTCEDYSFTFFIDIHSTMS